MSFRGTVARAILAVVLLGVTACGAAPPSDVRSTPDDEMSHMPGMGGGDAPPSVPGGVTVPRENLPGMPPPLNPNDLYAADRPNQLSPAVQHDRPLVYVPNLGSGTVSEIDPTTYKVIKTVRVDRGPQHVVPSWDLRTLWVNNNLGNSLTPIDPATGTFGRPVPVRDPYNLYFTPDGKHAIVMAEAMRQIVFRDPHTMAVHKVVPVPCAGVNHADFSADGRYFIATCEFSSELIKVDTEKQEIIGELKLPGVNPMPQDIKIAPDGKTWYVADMQSSGVWILDGDRFTTPTLLQTGGGTHGLYVSRDSKYLYITNRGEGSISLLDFATRALVAKWWIPGGGSPDMGNLSPDGKVFWVSGRYNGVVYAIDTGDGHLIAKIPVGNEPHGVCVWPQPGRYSLGHTGILR